MALLSTVTAGSLEESCILSTLVYIDLILLRTPIIEVHSSNINSQFQQALRNLTRTRKLPKNKDIFVWISATATAAMSIGISQSREASLIEKFNSAVARLESFSIT
jgi:hypothetical protein